MADLKKILETALNHKIIAFFHENPSTVDTARGIAGWLNHDETEIEKVLEYLTKENILTAHRTGSTIAYGYTQDEKLIGKIEKFLEHN